MSQSNPSVSIRAKTGGDDDEAARRPEGSRRGVIERDATGKLEAVEEHGPQGLRNGTVLAGVVGDRLPDGELLEPCVQPAGEPLVLVAVRDERIVGSQGPHLRATLGG